MSDLIERLRGEGPFLQPYQKALFHEAADEINRLRAENAALRADAERLDYLSKKTAWHIELSDHPAHEGELWIELHSIDGSRNDREYNLRGGGPTLRAAIDAARNHSEPVQNKPPEE